MPLPPEQNASEPPKDPVDPDVALVSADQVIVTIHGIGLYQEDSAIDQLNASPAVRDWINLAQKIDFNWCTLVELERDESRRLKRFSRALSEAAQLYADERRHLLGRPIRLVGRLLEVWLKIFWLWPAMLSVVVVPFVLVYIRMRAVPLYIAPVPRNALDIWLTMFRWTALAIFAMAAVALALAFFSQRTVCMALLRRTLLLPLHPVLCLMLRLSAAENIGPTAGTVKFTIAYGLIVVFLNSCSPDAGQQWSGLTPGTMVVAAIAVAWALFAITILSHMLERPLKLARDVFNYIGDADQRASIQSALDARLAPITDNAEVILIGHSLGSVIALDSLSNSLAWSRFARVSLITAGSPIRRLFQRFFPGLFFPASMPACFDHLCRRVRLAKWINVYRAGFLHGDPIGQALFSDELRGTDVSIRQTQRKLFAAHTGYWDDQAEEIHECVRKALTDRADSVLEGKSFADVGPSCSAVASDGAFHDWLARFAKGLAALSIWLAAILSVTGFFVVATDQRKEALTFVAKARSEGVKTTAMLAHHTAYWSYGTGAYPPASYALHLDFPVEVFEFEYVDSAGDHHVTTFREVESSPFETGNYFNSRALRERLDELRARNLPPNFIIRYLPGVPGKLIPVDAELQPSPSADPYFSVLVFGLGPTLIPLALLLMLLKKLANALTSTLAPAAHLKEADAPGPEESTNPT
jgi:hypothetical protein